MAGDQAKERYDVVIIGGGPAGLAAAVYTARQGLTTAVVAGELGGQAQWAEKIENYLGFELVSGAELARHFRDHVGRFDVDAFEGQHVDAVVPVDGAFEVSTREAGRYVGRAVIIASGRPPAHLAVPGEQELVGRGVSYCSTCDAAFFRGRPVVVTGPGESAVDAALQLAALDAGVLFVSKEPPKASPRLLEKLEADARIELRVGSEVTRIEGVEKVTGVVLRDQSGAEHTEAVDAIFVETGAAPPGEFTGGLVEVNEAGEILVGRDAMSSRPGVFAAGDVTDELGKQVIIAAGDGARAGVAAARWLQRQ